MSERAPTRVLLLAREGDARERLREALLAAGTELALVADPCSADPADALAARPHAVLVALEPAVEEALERFEALLSDPGVTVIFEEAELAAQRAGWDAARWVRHLAAKLNRHEDVLPPGSDPDRDLQPSPGALPSPADGARFDIAPFTEEAQDHAGEVPRAPLPEVRIDDDALRLEDEAAAPSMPEPGYDIAAAPALQDDDGLASLDAAGQAGGGVPGAAGFGFSLEPVDDERAVGGEREAAAPVEPDRDAGFESGFDPDLAGPLALEEIASDAPPATLAGDVDEGELDFSVGLTGPGGTDDGAEAGTAGDGEGYDFGFELAALDEADAGDDPDDAVAADAVAPAARADADEGAGAGEAAAPAWVGSSLELVDVDALLASVDGDSGPADAAAAAAQPAMDFDALEARVSALSLADVDSYGHGPLRGAVLVEGGLGGPDAVRQLLAALPENFPRPLLVRLQLDGGRYDRLVRQMERAARLPVALAEAGQGADPGTVYFVPPGLSLERDRARLVFVDDASGARPLLEALPPGDSAVLLLSGSGAASAEAAMAHAHAGLMVAAQALDGCYDPAASHALIAYGGDTAAPAELAARLAERWPS